MITLANLGEGEFVGDSEFYIDDDHFEQLMDHRIYPGDLVIAALADPVGRCCQIPESVGPAVVKADCFRFKPHDLMNRKYLLHYLNSPQSRRRFEEKAHGMGRVRVNLQETKSIPMAVPPTDVQDRIASRLENAEHRLDRVHSHLERIPPLVDKFKKSLLAEAFSGELTRDWRERNPDVEPASELLERIRPERRRRWVENYAANLADRARKRAEKKGEPFSEDDWQAYYEKKIPQGEDRYEEPEPVQDNPPDLPELPKNWAWTTVGEVAAVVEYGISEAMNESGPGVPILRMPNIEAGQLTFDELKYLPSDFEKFPDMFLEPGDVLFNRTNSAELVGKTAVYKDSHPTPCTFASYLIRVKPIRLQPDLLAAYINSPYGQQWLASARSQQVGQANVSGTKLKNFRIPLPPEDEQQVAVGKLRELREPVETANERSTGARKTVQKLQASILNEKLQE